MHEYVGPPLTRSSLARLLAAEGITESSYHLYGAHISDALVLDQRREGWVVFYSERGEESGVRRYDTEADACLYMLERLLRYEHYRYELVAGPAPAAEADAAFEAWLRDQGLTRIDFRDDEYKVDEVPWKRDEPDYRRYFVHRKRFRKRFGRWP